MTRARTTTRRLGALPAHVNEKVVGVIAGPRQTVGESRLLKLLADTERALLSDVAVGNVPPVGSVEILPGVSTSWRVSRGEIQELRIGPTSDVLTEFSRSMKTAGSPTKRSARSRRSRPRKD
jgi:hypothetical protein